MVNSSSWQIKLLTSSLPLLVLTTLEVSVAEEPTALLNIY